MSRRSFLQVSGAAAAAATVLPDSLQAAMAAPAAAGGLDAVEHVVIFMQENRSFDLYFGGLKGVRGFGDPVPRRFQNGRDVFAQPDGSSYLYPFRLNAATTKAGCPGTGLPHGWSDGHTAFDGGRWDKWIPAKGRGTMGYFTRADVPFQYALADAFTVCDRNFCSTMSSTNPNRLHLWTGMLDAAGQFGGPATDNGLVGKLSWETYPETLERAGVTWQVYQEQDDFTDNSLEWFKNFRNAPTSSNLWKRGVQWKASALDWFADDVHNDRLPQVSWIVANAAESEHPGPSTPWHGAHMTHKVLDALAANPAVWQKTVFVLNYDENDGFFDHVAPPFPPAGTAGEFVNGAPVGLGPRVPMIIASPWSQGGWVCSETFDHTSVIRFLERWLGVQCAHISAWRRSVCGDLTSAFDFTTPLTSFPGLPATAAAASAAGTRCGGSLPAATPPSGTSSLPSQEAGTKPLRPLPYQPNVNGRTDLAAGRFWTDFSNVGGSAPVTFEAATMEFRAYAVWSYLVAAGGSASDYWSAQTYGAGKYSLDVHGPNGFLRTFRGDINLFGDAAKPHLEVVSSYDGPTRTVRLTLDNTTGGAAATFTVTSNRYVSGGPWTYAVPAHGTATHVVSTNQGWYDVTVTANISDGFVRRLAGHLENGAASVTGVGFPPLGPSLPAVLDRTGWTAAADSAETSGENGAAANVLDGSSSTLWHTAWSAAVDPPHPHQITLDMKVSRSVSGLVYEPRPGTQYNGTIAGYEVYVSADGTTWGSPVASGTWPKDKVAKTVTFAAINGRFVRLRSLSEVNGQPWASAAEINVIGL